MVTLLICIRKNYQNLDVLLIWLVKWFQNLETLLIWLVKWFQNMDTMLICLGEWFQNLVRLLRHSGKFYWHLRIAASETSYISHLIGRTIPPPWANHLSTLVKGFQNPGTLLICSGERFHHLGQTIYPPWLKGFRTRERCSSVRANNFATLGKPFIHLG